MMNEFGIEVIVASYERIIKRLWILCIILILALLGTNFGWVYYESQFETIEETTQEVTQDTDDGGDNHFVGGDCNGEASD